jgi:ATP/maltotriose-dependent transcriptional regulator MalT
VLIDGTGGMGKTSLAVRAAELAAPQFDRVLFVSTKSQKLTPEGKVALSTSIVAAYPDLLNQIAQLLALPKIAEKPETERADLIKDAMHPEKVLLILDNMENLEKAQQNLLYEFLQDLPPSCKAIVTSRRRTDVEGRIIRLEKLDQDAALAFLEELSADRPLLAKATPAERLHLYEETGGNPLLLRWVVGQLGRGSCRSIANALALCRKASDSNDPLEFIFGDLLETFTEAETKALAALTYFTQKIAVKHIAELADLSKTAAQTALADLANRALIMPDETEEHFALVPMVADFLRNKRPEVIAETGDRLEKRAYALIVENGYQEHERFPVLDAAWPGVPRPCRSSSPGQMTDYSRSAMRWRISSTSPAAGMNGSRLANRRRLGPWRRGITTKQAGGPIRRAGFITCAGRQSTCWPMPTMPQRTGNRRIRRGAAVRLAFVSALSPFACAASETS